MLSQYVNTGQPGRINSFDRYFQVVDRCAARRHRVGYCCACENTNLTSISTTWGNKSQKHLSLPKCLRKLWTVYMHELVIFLIAISQEKITKKSETNHNQGIPNQVPKLGFVSLSQIWDFCGYSLNTLKLGIRYFFLCIHVYYLKIHVIVSEPNKWNDVETESLLDCWKRFNL